MTSSRPPAPSLTTFLRDYPGSSVQVGSAAGLKDAGSVGPGTYSQPLTIERFAELVDGIHQRNRVGHPYLAPHVVPANLGVFLAAKDLSHPVVSITARHAITKIVQTYSVERLREIIANPSEDISLRFDAIKICESKNDPSALPELHVAMRDEDPIISNTATHAVASLAEKESLAHLIALLHEAVSAIKILTELENQVSSDLLEGQDPEIRKAEAARISKLNRPYYDAVGLKLLHAIRGIEYICKKTRDRSAETVLIEILRNREFSSSIHRAAFHALDAMGSRILSRRK